MIPQGFHLVRTEHTEDLETYVNAVYAHLQNFSDANTADLSNNDVIEWVAT